MSKRRVVGHPRGLVGHGPGDLASAVAGIHAPETTDAVEVAATVAVEDVGPLGLCDDKRSLFVEGGEVGPRVDKVILVLLPDVLCVVGGKPSRRLGIGGY